MTINHARQKLTNLINYIPEEELHTAIKFIEFLVGAMPEELSKEKYFQALDSLPYTDEPWTEEDENDYQESRKDIAEGRVITLEQYEKERGLA
ncbi:MAG: hypothetical protein K8T10_09295 [Candidatus Eremiobacteraeota bacterium]|nr:hypothetical protein [Candidatus Eremiobacteraeota bacterium]